MLASYALTLLSTYAVLVNADANPISPAPGDVFTAGKPCTVKWAVDAGTSSAWSEMSIELMSGSNDDMVHITTLTKVDGTAPGEYTYTCPEVTPYSDIYFYQLSAPGQDNTWTGRFTITAADGTTTAPQNPTEPDGQAIPWGVGNLKDPSTAVAAPGGSGASTPVSVTGTATATGSVSASVSATVQPTSSGLAVVKSSSSSSKGESSASHTGSAVAATKSNGALGLDARVWQSGVAFGASAMAFALLL